MGSFSVTSLLLDHPGKDGFQYGDRCSSPFDPGQCLGQYQDVCAKLQQIAQREAWLCRDFSEDFSEGFERETLSKYVFHGEIGW